MRFRKFIIGGLLALLFVSSFMVAFYANDLNIISSSSFVDMKTFHNRESHLVMLPDLDQSKYRKKISKDAFEIVYNDSNVAINNFDKRALVFNDIATEHNNR